MKIYCDNKTTYNANNLVSMKKLSEIDCYYMRNLDQDSIMFTTYISQI